MMLENLLNKYEENRRLTNEQLNDTIKPYFIQGYFCPVKGGR